MKVVKKIEDHRLITAISSLLFVILLTSQVSQLTNKANTSYILDSTYGALEISDPENKPQDTDLFTPDVIHASHEPDQSKLTYYAEYDYPAPLVVKHFYSVNIRSPPHFS